jgi:8-oxo-dGTP diphosphatase
MSHQAYVAGFLFDKFFERVVLIRKQKPAWQKGKLNGVGGKIEPGETPLEAMRREFCEETGMDVQNWRSFCNLGGDDWTVHFFFATGEVENAKTTTEEEIGVWDISDDACLWSEFYDLIPNLHWLIPMATTFGNGLETAAKFSISEVARQEVICH